MLLPLRESLSGPGDLRAGPDFFWRGLHSLYRAGDEWRGLLSGQLEIDVDTGSDLIEYRVKPNSFVTFDDGDFDDLCQEMTGSRLRYVRFELPSSSKGTLYYAVSYTHLRAHETL